MGNLGCSVSIVLSSALPVLMGCGQEPVSVPAPRPSAHLSRRVNWIGQGIWLKADTHTHTNYSDASHPLSEVADRARAEGCDVLAITDHTNPQYQTATPEVSSARFWFHTEKARREITSMLSEWKNGKLLSFEEMAEFRVTLADSSYGEMFYFLEPGSIFFPHDFYHPLANFYLALSDRMQRRRLRDPRHKGNHGYLPYFDAEKSFVALLDKDFKVNTNCGDILDVAPSILGILGYEPPAAMQGRCLFSS